MGVVAAASPAAVAVREVMEAEKGAGAAGAGGAVVGERTRAEVGEVNRRGLAATRSA